MSWLLDLHAAQPIAHAVLMLSVVALCGLALGGVKVRGIGLGSAGVLFAGIVFGHFGKQIEPAILEFAKEFGLILFVFTIGLQLGPGFFASLRRDGLRLNLLAAAIVLAGALAAVTAGWLLGIDPAAVPGVFAGATTNTPALGAAQETLRTLPAVSPQQAGLPALAYAVAYPAGIAGIIGSLLLVKALFRIDTVAEAEAVERARERSHEPVERRNLVVENPNLEGLAIRDLPGVATPGVTISRIHHHGEPAMQIATPGTLVHRRDVVLAVGTKRALDDLQRVVGNLARTDLMTAPGAVSFRRIVVTRREVLGKSLEELALGERYGVTVTRVARADVEMPAAPGFRLQFGDVLRVVGEQAALEQAARELGNSVKALGATQFIPLFTGIALGIVLGVLPIAVPGLPQPVRLGLAGGPLIVAILVSRAGHLGPLVWYMPPNANLAFRELGMTLFLACVGLKAGSHFFATVFTTTGLAWLAASVATTVVPLLAIGCFARIVWQLDYMTLSGVLAGSMTDPPALAFACAASGSEAPSAAYATVYPLTMLLRIAGAQLLALALCR